MPAVQATNAIRVTFNGSLCEGQEIWSFGVHLAAPDGSDVASDFAALDMPALYAAFTTSMIGTADQGLVTGATFDSVRASLVDSFGTQIGESKFFGPFTGVPGVDTGDYIPQHSIVVTLNTDDRSGRAARGRFYLPTGYGLPGDDGYLSSADVDSLSDSVVAFLTAVNGVAPGDLQLSTFSPTVSGSSSIIPLVNEITSVSIGNVVDTQRRRRNGLQERYSNAAL